MYIPVAVCSAIFFWYPFAVQIGGVVSPQHRYCMGAWQALNMAARIESSLLRLCLGILNSLSQKEGSLAIGENKAYVALLSGGVCIIAGGAEFSLLAPSL